MRLPEIRAELHTLAAHPRLPPTLAQRLHELADETIRRRHGKSKATATKMTPDLARRIRMFAKKNPGLSQFKIGQAFNVNQGRVSEALHGERH